MASIGTANAAPGEIDTGELTVGETRDGSLLELPVCVINGADEGKTLYIQAASDGDELNGVGSVRALVPQIDPTELSGTIFIVGIVNIHGFRVAKHRNPIDDTKLNRTYPGNENGTSSERIAAATFDVASSADLVLDLHQGSTSRMLHETRVRCGPHHHLYEECLSLAKTFNCGHIFTQKGPDGQLARVIPDEGVPAIDPELGGSIGLCEESVQIGVQGVINVLIHYGFLSGEVTLREQIRAAGFKQYSALTGGLIDFDLDLGDYVERGDRIFCITDVFGRVKTETVADVEGIFWRTRRLPQVATGEYVCSIGTDIDQL